MTTPSDTNTPKQSVVADEIRERIVSGEFKPGGRIPTQAQMVDRFKVSGVTVQRALEKLAHDGFIDARGRRGTYVTNRPPHLHRYALIFTDNRFLAERSRFSTAIDQQAKVYAGNHPVVIDSFYGVTGHADDEQHQQILRDARAHRYAGLIIVNPYALHQTPLLHEEGIIRSSVVTMHDPGDLSLPLVSPDTDHLVDLALEAMVERGAQSFAVISSKYMLEHAGDYLRRAARQRSLRLPEYWVQVAPTDRPEGGRNLAHLMFRSGQDDRPKHLLVLDDNLLEYVGAGLVAAGVQVGSEVQVVAHTNFPDTTPSMIPVTKVGFDVGRIVSATIDAIDAQRQGRPVDPFTRIPASHAED